MDNLNGHLPFFALLVILFVAELIYFQIAKRFGIIDKPNERSSHSRPVIRGGGIIFCVSILIWFVGTGFSLPWLIAGITAAGLISFIDDIDPQPARIRFAIHFLAVLCIFYSIGLFNWAAWLWITALVVSIGALNAFNFMDGINGITGVYAIVMLVSFLVLQVYYDFTDPRFIYANIAAVLVFLFFNFRRKAACFAGDVGSVTMAFVLIFLLLQLIYTTQNLIWVLLFLVYGIDSVVTIAYRIARRENIFKAHRTHLYQFLCNEFKWQHRVVAVLYGVIQLAMNAVVIVSVYFGRPWVAIVVALGILVAYMISRMYVTQRMQRAGSRS
jgi:UDP-N-acetylmuramyl pentapeptide phosphotransferase/UDP-N-acetylglucosamine-1-phosphate transferase